VSSYRDVPQNSSLAIFHQYQFKDMITGKVFYGFGHGGIGGSMACCIPSHQVSFCVVVNRMATESVHQVVNSLLEPYRLNWIDKDMADVGQF
jgi:hypothetical protein